MSSIRSFQDLAAWQRADELRTMCEELTQLPRVQRDLTFRKQLSDAASSVARNIAEGFGRGTPRENAQYVRVAKGSANEVFALLIEAQSKAYITTEDFPRLEVAVRRTIGTLVGYLKYLESCDLKPAQKRKR